MPRFKLNRTLVCGTDVAGFFVFHPDDLQHRMDSPLAWYAYGFACEKEFRAGRLVTFSTGGDGGYKNRVTSGELTEREQRWDAGCWEFRLLVRHGRVLLDNGDCLPNDDYCDEPAEDSELWIELPNGAYRVIVHVLNWAEEPGALNDGYATDDALPSYVIRFQQVKTLEEVQPELFRRPLLDSFAPPEPELDFLEQSAWRTPAEPLPRSGFLFLSAENWFHGPGAGHEMTLPQKTLDRCWEIEDRLVVWGDPEARPGDLVILSRLGASSGTGKVYTGSFRGERLVRIIQRNSRKNGDQVQVEPFEPPASQVAPVSLRKLKQAFQEYTATNATYRERAENPDFQAEMAEALPSAEAVCNLILHQLALPAARKLELLQLSEKDRVRELRELLTGE